MLTPAQRDMQSPSEIQDGRTRGSRRNNTREERSTMNNLMTRFVREEEGQDLIEYSLLAALIAVASIVAMTALGTQISELFGRIGTRLGAAAPAA